VSVVCTSNENSLSYIVFVDMVSGRF